MKVNRHAKIIELINKYHIETQEELADHDHHQVAALRRKRQLVGVVAIERARGLHERHLHRQTALQRQRKKKIMTHFIIQVNIAIQNVENMRKTVREFIIQTVTMKHLHVQESRKA